MTNTRSAQTNRQWILEISWWAFSLVLTALVLLPIYSNQIAYPFYVYNAVSVIVAVNVTRYLFNLNISWLRDRFKLQGLLAFIMIPLIFIIGQGLNEFITYMDNNGPDTLTKHLADNLGRNMQSYLSSEYFFFGVWAIIAAVILPFRVMYIVWARYRNKVKR